MKRGFLIFAALFMTVPALVAQAVTEDGYAIPQPGRTFAFPRDHGSHPEFRTEWWYVTGHLDAPDGRRFGFQVTFFRQAARGQDGLSNELHLAHAALLDAKTGAFLHEEKLTRAGWDAASSTATLDVRNGNWSLRLDESTQRLHLSATVKGEAVLKLELEPAKPVVTFGKDGVSRKGSAPSAASHYLTFTRLKTTGSVKLGATTHSVTGSAWMDHEFSSSHLDEGQIGWDWASLQLHDGTERMVYRMRRSDGQTDPASTLNFISADATVRTLPPQQFTWKVLETWHSPHTGADYPIRVEIAAEGKSYTLRPLARDQEQGGSISGLPYWEGACDVLDASGDVIGRAFLELAGYAGDLQRHLRPAAQPPSK